MSRGATYHQLQPSIPPPVRLACFLTSQILGLLGDGSVDTAKRLKQVPEDVQNEREQQKRDRRKQSGKQTVEETKRFDDAPR